MTDSNQPPTPTTTKKPNRLWVFAIAIAVVAAVVVAGVVVFGSDDDEQDARPSVSVVPADALTPSESDVIAATGSTPLPAIQNAVIADEANPPRALGDVDGVPNTDRLDFLFEYCEGDLCFRDAAFTGSDVPDQWPATRPFHVRHGFVNETGEPLGPRFDVAIYAFQMADREFPEVELTSEAGGEPVGPTRRYSSDYILRGETDACGPTYRDQTGTVTCEWFVHEFPDGLPQVGRWALWAVWEAPCSAWIELGFTDECDDPDEVVSYFSSGVDSPFEADPG